MPTIQFQFVDPQPGGVDAPTGERVRCALLEPEAVSGTYRSVREFVVPLVDGAGSAKLSPGAWYVAVDGVEGVPERWVLVPSGSSTIPYPSLPDVDLSTIPVTPETLPRWSGLDARVSALEDSGGAVTIEPDPAHNGAVLLTVNATPPAPAAPVVTLQPVDVTAGVGGTATFSAAATGTPVPTAQWQRSVDGGPWVNVAGATDATYTTGALTVDDDGTQFRVTFTNAADTAVSDAALLTVTAGAAPVITFPTSNQAVYTNLEPSFVLTSTATGNPAPTVQWQRSQLNATSYGGAVWSDIPGATSGTPTFSTASEFTGSGQLRWYRPVWTSGGVSTIGSGFVVANDFES